MYEFHGWIGIAETAEESDAGNLPALLQELCLFVADISWQTATLDLNYLNGQPFLRMDGLVNRMRDEARKVEAIYAFVADRLPGSYGLLYERADDMPTPPGPGGFRVGILARGRLRYDLDPFLSPCHPIIED
ncbi:MAG TPA: Imm7 family immunity protein [Actinoplanes sp.]